MMEFHPELHPGAKNNKRGTLPIGSLPRPTLVPPSRFERLTSGLGNRCSIH